MINGTKKTIAQAITNVENVKKLKLESSQKITTAALWMDLLNFRKHLDGENWDFNKEEFILGIKRVAVLHEAAILAMNERYEIIQLNDSIVISIDILEHNSKKIVEDFLALTDHIFEIATLSDDKIGGCGVRGVIAKGIRYNLRGNLGWKKPPSNPNEWANPSFFCPRPIMMNTAFGRAYAIESSGELIKASSLYVEKSLIFDYGASIMKTWNLECLNDIKNFGSFFLVRQ